MAARVPGGAAHPEDALAAPPASAPNGQETQREVRLLAKRFGARGKRHQNECYGAVLDPKRQSLGLAYLRVGDKRESLVYQPSPGDPEVVLAQDTYILSPHFAAGFLLWVQRMGKDWRIRAAHVDTREYDSIREPFTHQGRPMSLASWSQGGLTWLVWEERAGRSTRIRMARIQNGNFSAPVDVTNGAFNAYDPVCCTSDGKTLWVAYCAFAGNYQIHIQELTAEGKPAGPPHCVSDQPGPCLYPSVWPSGKGGLWFSYTCFGAGSAEVEQPFLGSFRHAAQLRFLADSGQVIACLLKEGEVWAPLAPQKMGEIQGFQAAGLVFPARHAGHSQVYEAPNGQVWLLFRQHGHLKPNRFEQEDKPLTHSTRPTRRDASTSTRNHPDICLCTLSDSRHGWSDSMCLIPRAHLEAPLSQALDGFVLRLAFTEDARRTGWSQNGEMFDDQGQLGAGIAHVELASSTTPTYDLRPYVLRPVAGSSIEEKSLDRTEGSLICAVGQTHRHSSLSVCRREMDREPHTAYRFMLDVMRDDFGGITDHCYNMWHTEMLIMRKLAEYYYVPGEFVAIPAYEWTGSHRECKHDGGPFGHMNPLWLEEDGDLEVYSPCDPQSPGRSPRRLWQMYKGRKIITPPHHPVDNMHAWYWRDDDDVFIPVVEIFQSFRGSAEQPQAAGVTNYPHRPNWPWLVDVLKRGRRLGFIASADHGGIARAGVLVKELTRSGLYEALMAKRCFATTCVACRVELTCNGQMMGQEVASNKGDFRLRVWATELVREVQVVRNGETMEVKPVGNNQVDHHWRADRQTSGEFWYCRMIFESGDVAWSSPIWLV